MSANVSYFNKLLERERFGIGEKASLGITRYHEISASTTCGIFVRRFRVQNRPVST
jgi:hypothetical protein